MNSVLIFFIGVLIAVSLEILVVSSSPHNQNTANKSPLGSIPNSFIDSDVHLKRGRRRIPKIDRERSRPSERQIDLDTLPKKLKVIRPRPKPSPTTKPAPSSRLVVSASRILTEIGKVASIAGRLKSDPSAVAEANRELHEGNTKLKQLRLSYQRLVVVENIPKPIRIPGRLITFIPKPKLESKNIQQWRKVSALFDFKRLIFFTDKRTRLNDPGEANRWADAVLSQDLNGVDHLLTKFHDLIMGRGKSTAKSIINMFIDLLRTSDGKFWEKVDDFINMLIEMQLAGYEVRLIALGIKGKPESELSRVVDLAEQRLAQQDSVIAALVGSQSLRVWPFGTYGLVQVAGTKCPVGDWATGWREHDTEDRKGANAWSTSLHMRGKFKRSDMRWNFCIKKFFGNSRGPKWPNGKYCIFASQIATKFKHVSPGMQNGCPVGMSRGSIFWDDEDHDNNNKKSGTLPDGVYGTNTKIFFCCKTTGNTASEIRLPIEKPFILFPLDGQGCQKVYKMNVYEEYFHWDCEDRRNHKKVESPHPKDHGGSENIRLYMCYYNRTASF